MVRATRSCSYAPDSTAYVEGRSRQGRALVPASPLAAAIVAAAAVEEHHSTHQRRDKQGRFVAAGGSGNARSRWRTATNQRRNRVVEEEAVVPLLLPKPELEEVVFPDMPPGFTPHDRHAQPPVVEVRIDLHPL